KAHGIGYLMPPRGLRRDETENEWTTEFWRAVLSNEGISSKGIKLDWLDRAAAMRVTVSSPAVMGRLKNYVKPFDFMLAPVTRGVLQRMHVIAGEYIPCGKEFKRKLEQGVIIDADTLKPGGTPDDPVDANAKIYLPGKVALSDSLKDEIRKAGTRELMRHGIG